MRELTDLSAANDTGENDHHDHDDHYIVDNFRPVQPLNTRTVYSSFPAAASGGTGRWQVCLLYEEGRSMYYLLPIFSFEMLSLAIGLLVWTVVSYKWGSVHVITQSSVTDSGALPSYFNCVLVLSHAQKTRF